MITSQITVSGTYFSIDEFLFLMETLTRAAKVTGITLAPFSTGEEGSTTATGLQLLMSIEFYTTDTSSGPASVPGPTVVTAPAAPTGTTGSSTTTTDTGEA